MVLAGSERQIRAWHGLRLGLLVLVTLFVAHDAVYAVEFGLGGAFAGAMSHGGHDGYWSPFMTLAITAAGVLAAGTAVRILRLRTMIARPSDRRAPRGTLPRRPNSARYQAELLRLWTLLFPLVTAAYAVQENIEHLLGHGHLPGMEVLVGSEAQFALPVLALITLASAALGALVRWRVAVLLEQVARSLLVVRDRGLGARRPARHWWLVAAAAAARWILARTPPGRAPPAVAAI